MPTVKSGVATMMAPPAPSTPSPALIIIEICEISCWSTCSMLRKTVTVHKIVAAQGGGELRVKPFI